MMESRWDSGRTFGLRVRTMPAPAAAAIAASQMIRGGKHLQAARLEIKVAGQNRGRDGRLPPMEGRDAGAADTCFVPKVRRHLFEEGLGNFQFETPARALVSGDGAELAIIRPAAQRALPRVRRLNPGH